jgi:V/A-type H+-transporting ATPase subunit D
MILDVNPTRMELLRLKKKLAISKRGHKLLKDKLDELMRLLLALLKEAEEMYQVLDANMHQMHKSLALGEYSSFPEAMHSALSYSGSQFAVKSELKSLLNIKIPTFQVSYQAMQRSYGFAQTSLSADLALEILENNIQILVDMAAKEKSILLITSEIEKTRRRVNALEYILIPNIQETIKFISLRMAELERNNRAQLMRIKDSLRAPSPQSSAHPGVKIFPF